MSSWRGWRISGRETGVFLSYRVMHGLDPEMRLRECTRLRRQYLPGHTHSVDEFLQGQVVHHAPEPLQDMIGETVN